jgi:hypothetical protein
VYLDNFPMDGAREVSRLCITLGFCVMECLFLGGLKIDGISCRLVFGHKARAANAKRRFTRSFRQGSMTETVRVVYTKPGAPDGNHIVTNYHLVKKFRGRQFKRCKVHQYSFVQN